MKVERGMFMAVAVRKHDDSYSAEETINILYDKLDEAIDDMENGRVISEEELWEELELK